MNPKRILKNVSPFNNEKDMPKALFILKKFLAFIVVFIAFTLVGEAIVIGAMYAMGYQPLNGVMPQGIVAELIKYCGYSLLFVFAFIYCKVVEKRTVASLGLSKRGFDCFAGALVAILLISFIMIVCCVAGAFEFTGFGKSVNAGCLALLLLGFVIQSFAEEFVCRSFLMQSLLSKTSFPTAVLVSSTAFALPHFPTLFEAEFKFAVVGVLNLYLVSAVFSLLYVLRDNVYIAVGLHCVWNFTIYGVLGLSVSGSNTTVNGILNFNAVSENLINGGVYGIEASVVTTIVLGITALVLAKRVFSRGVKNGL